MGRSATVSSPKKIMNKQSTWKGANSQTHSHYQNNMSKAHEIPMSDNSINDENRHPNIGELPASSIIKQWKELNDQDQSFNWNNNTFNETNDKNKRQNIGELERNWEYTKPHNKQNGKYKGCDGKITKKFPCTTNDSIAENIDNVVPLQSTRDPRRQREMKSRKPKSKEGVLSLLKTTKIGGSSNTTNRAKIVKPAYAFTNATTGLLEITTGLPPSPSIIKCPNDNAKTKTAPPGLYPIALNGGGCGLYRDPRSFAMSAATTSYDHNSKNADRKIKNCHVHSSHVSFPWNMNLISSDDIVKKKSNSNISIDDGIILEEDDLEANYNNHTINELEYQPNQIQLVDQQAVETITALRQTQSDNSYQNKEGEQIVTPWKIWEKVHNAMVRVVESRQEQEQHNKFLEHCCLEESSDFALPPLSEKHKASRLSSIYNSDGFDFALVLHRKRVYSFWADLLDFRAENGILQNNPIDFESELLDEVDEDNEETSNISNEDKSKKVRGSFDYPIDQVPLGLKGHKSYRQHNKVEHTYNDEIDDEEKWIHEDIYATPVRGSKKRSLRHQISEELPLDGDSSLQLSTSKYRRKSSIRERKKDKQSKYNNFKKGTKIKNTYYHADLPVHKGEASIDDTGQRVFWKNQSLFERAMATITPPKLLEEDNMKTTEKEKRFKRKNDRSNSFRRNRLSPLGTSSRRIASAIRSSLTNATSPLRSKFQHERESVDENNNDNSATPIISNNRRKWGSLTVREAYGKDQKSTANLFSPPIHSLQNKSKILDTNNRLGKRQRKTRTPTTTAANQQSKIKNNDESTKQKKRKKKRRNPNSLIAEQIPNQVVPRGIFKRTNGMEEFLSALKRGFVVRRHRPNAESAFIKIFSSDGGDTIQFSYVPYEDAIITLREQGIRYNRKKRQNKTRSNTMDNNESRPHIDPASLQRIDSEDTSGYKLDMFSPSLSKRWSSDNTISEREKMKTFAMPDFIAAEKYRMAKNRHSGGVRQAISELATRATHSGVIKTAEIIAVHPATHLDKFSVDGEFGSCTLRESPSENEPKHTFTLVMPSPSMMFTSGTSWVNSIGSGTYSASAIRSATERWCEGVGSANSFRYLDLEAATEGEYWTIFRGFLLLHRDASLGRGAAQRASGFGSNYNKHELEQRNQKLRRQKSNSNMFSYLNKNPQKEKCEFSEPEEMTWLYHFVSSNISKVLRWYDQSKNNEDIKFEQQIKPAPPPSDYFLGFKSTGTQTWSRLRQAGLETQRIYALDKHRVMIKLRCPPDRLMDVAEVLRVKLRTRDGFFAPFRESTISQFLPSNDMFGSKPSDYNGNGSLFRSSERQLIIDFIIRSRIRDSGAELGQNTDLGKDIEIRSPLHMHAGLELLYKVWVLFWKKENWDLRDGTSMDVVSTVQNSTFTSSSSNGIVSFPASYNGVSVFDKSQNRNMAKDNTRSSRTYSWLYRLLVGSFFQPLDSIEQYFGERVAFYFAWIQHCSVHLIFISILGLITFLLQVCTGHFDHPIRPYFASVVMIWSFLVMVNWRKRQRYLAHRWGTLNYREEETTRPQYHGVYKQCEITGEWIVHYPSWKRWAKYAISLPLTAAFTIATGIGILMIYANRDILLARYFGDKLEDKENMLAIDWTINSIGKSEPIESVELTKEQLADPYFWFIAAGSPLILGLALPLLNFLLMKVSISLNEFENYRTETHYRNHLIVKTFAFRFVSNFAALYYYAYMSIGVERRKVENGILRVGTSLFIYVTVSHWWNIFLSIYLPLYIHKWKMHRQRINLREENRRIEGLQIKLETDKKLTKHKREQMRQRLINSRILLEQAESNVWEEMMLPEHDPFFDYIHVVIQFAYVACFSAVLPLTPLIVLINHLLSMRLNAYKICRGRRRPLAQKTGGIGVWEHVLHVVTVIAVFTNCSLMALTSSQFHIVRETWGNLGLFGVIVGWEHIMLMIKYTMQSAFSKNPKFVDDSIKKEQFAIARKRNFTMRAKKERRSGSYPKPEIMKDSNSFSALLGSDIEESNTSSKSDPDEQVVGSTSIKMHSVHWNEKQGANSFRKRLSQNSSSSSSPPLLQQYVGGNDGEAQGTHSISHNNAKKRILRGKESEVQSSLGTYGRESYNIGKMKQRPPPLTPKRRTISSEILPVKKSSDQTIRGNSISSYDAVSLGDNNVKKRIQDYHSRYSHQTKTESDHVLE